MKLTHRQLKKIIKDSLTEATELSQNLYGSLEKTIANSKFWLEGNTEDDGDYEDVPGLDLIHQTSAAQYLQDVLQATIDNAGEDIIIAVQSPELDANPGFLLTPDKPQYPDSVISGGYATITPDGKQAVVLNMSLFDDSFNDNDVNPQRIARKGGAILRHEIVHLQQVAARAESEGISLIDAFENFRKEPKSIPPEGAGRQQYIKSHIEIDAHAHQAADELLALYGKEEALRLISKTVDFEDLGVDLPHAVEDYLIDNPSGKTARQFRKKVYEYINSISEKIDEATGRVAIRPQAGPGERIVKSAGPAAAAAYDIIFKDPIDILSDPKASDSQKTTAALDLVELIPFIGTPVGVANGLIKLSMEPPQYLSALGSFAAAILSAIGLGIVAKAGGSSAIIAVFRNAVGRQALTRLLSALKTVLKETGPKGVKLAGRLDKALAAGKSVNIEFLDDIAKTKKNLRSQGMPEFEIKQLEAQGFFDASFWDPANTGANRFDPRNPPQLLRKALEASGYEEALRVGLKASKFLPDIAYPVFAKKLLVRVGSGVKRAKPDDILVLFDDAIELSGGGSATGFRYSDVVRMWDKIPGNPAGKGFKDFIPNGIGFNLSDVLERKELMSLAKEMFDQFPAMSKVYDDVAGFADDLYGTAIKVGGHPDRGGVFRGKLVEITPWNSSEEFADAWIRSSNVTDFIRNTLAKHKSTFAHEFDHWLRARGLQKRGAKLGNTYTDDVIDHSKWLKTWSEFEAEFTAGQMKLLDDLLKNGPNDALIKALNNPAEFEKYFLQNLPERSWGGQVGKKALKTVRKRLFDTEKGLYYALRRTFDIAPAPLGPLPETLVRELIRKMIYEKSPVRGYHPDESYEEGTVKNLMLDKETSHGGWPEGPSKSYTSDEPVNKQIADWLKKMKMIKH